MCHFWGAFFEQKIDFWVSSFVKLHVVIKFGGVILGKMILEDADFDQISHTWVKILDFVLNLGYIFSMACKFWSIVFAKIYKF